MNEILGAFVVSGLMDSGPIDSGERLRVVVREGRRPQRENTAKG